MTLLQLLQFFNVIATCIFPTLVSALIWLKLDSCCKTHKLWRSCLLCQDFKLYCKANYEQNFILCKTNIIMDLGLKMKSKEKAKLRPTLSTLFSGLRIIQIMIFWSHIIRGAKKIKNLLYHVYLIKYRNIVMVEDFDTITVSIF